MIATKKTRKTALKISCVSDIFQSSFVKKISVIKYKYILNRHPLSLKKGKFWRALAPIFRHHQNFPA